jgi:protein-S-isoprenylcysteine O-methyltransferase Ste14
LFPIRRLTKTTQNTLRCIDIGLELQKEIWVNLNVALENHYMEPRNVIRHITGYLGGISIFCLGIPFGLYMVSTKLNRPIWGLADTRLRIALSLLTGIVGITFLLWSNIYLFFIGKGGPADGFGVAVSPRTKCLVTSGPYRYTRNPMAFGALSSYLALALFFNSAISAALVTILSVGAYLYLRRIEEKRLLKDFGDAYEQYRKTVSILVPLPARKKT